MKLTKKEAQNIADNYNLGKTKNLDYFPRGWVNWNYKLETDKGIYVIKIVGGNNPIEFRKRRMKEQAGILNHLSKKKFPYEIINPIKNKRGNYLMNFKKRSLWVYHYLKGEQKKKVTKKEFQNIAKALALFHNYSKTHKVQEDFRKIFPWLRKEYKRLSTRKAKNKRDKLFLENNELFRKILEEVAKVDYGKLQANHRDFHEGNMIFNKQKVKGIIDFDGIRKAPRALDIVLSILNTSYIKHGWTKEKQKVFLKAYEKINPLTKKEKKLFYPLLIHHHLILFLWFYNEMEKNQDKAYNMMKWSSKDLKNFYKEWKQNN